MTEDFDFHMGRRADRTYVSKSFVEQDSPRTKRIPYKVFDGEQDEFGKVLDEIVVKERRHSGRVEIRAYFYEDNRQIERITLVKFYNGEPSRQVQYTLRGEELRQFSALLHAVRAMPFDAETGERFDDEVLSGAANLMSDAGMRRFLRERPELVIEVAKNDLTQQDIVGLAYRKQQLEVFESLLSDQAFFSGKMQEWEKHRPEDVWQHFFENNTWIFGYGLQYIFASRFETAKRETMKQWIRGSRIGESAKEADALLRTLGLISSICFVELKRHDVDVLKAGDYRSDCWQISSELAGAVGQVQKVVQLAVETIGNELKIEDSDGYETGEQAFLYQPKAFVIIGTLDEFRRDGQVSREKFGSFELFRRHLTNPEIITFDELLERARHIVEHGRSGLQCGPAPVEDAESFWDDDVPF